MSDQLAHKAVARWPISVSGIAMAAQRENIVYRVTAKTGETCALRLHRQGYHDGAALESELMWMAAVAERGIKVPVPLQSKSGTFIERVEGRHIDMLSWLPGKPMGTAATQLDVENRSEALFSLGVALARLHAASDDWQPPPTFKRHAWDLDGLLGEQPFWGRFWDNPVLTSEERALLSEARAVARDQLNFAMPHLDYGLIHADPVRENVLLHGDDTYLIDFDDGGFGFRLFDLATVLLKCRHEADFDMLQRQIVAGYQSVRPLQTQHMSLMLALRAFTYVGWIAPRLREPWAPQRLERFKQDALFFADLLVEL